MKSKPFLFALAATLVAFAWPGAPARADGPVEPVPMPFVEPLELLEWPGEPGDGTVSCSSAKAIWFAPPPPDPIRRAVIVDDDVGGSSTAGIFTSNITVLGGGGGTRSSALRITIALTSTTSALNLLVIKGGVTTVLPLNGGTALTSAAGLHTFVVGVTTAMTSDAGAATTLTYNLSLTTATRVGFALVEECQSDGL